MNMLDVSGVMAISGDGGDAAEGGGASAGSSGPSSIPGGFMMEESSGGGNRWPKQETVSLLKIRSEMDAAFRDSTLKGPLWEEVSRKMAELGFQRSAKKCKEKFENVYKYHKRTKDVRASKPDGKTYRFFDHLQALENNPPLLFTPSRPQPPASRTTTPPHVINSTVSSRSPNPLNFVPPTTLNNSLFPTLFQNELNTLNLPRSLPFQAHALTNLPSDSSSSSTSSYEDVQRRRGRKRKWNDFFERLSIEVIQKQEELQKKFLDSLEKRERERLIREEAWRVQETARLNREHDLLVQERSIAAAKDAAVIAFLQKITEKPGSQLSPAVPVVQPLENLQPPRHPTTSSVPPVPSIVPAVNTVSPPRKLANASKSKADDDGGGYSSTAASSSRWPKREIEALIERRTNLDPNYQENVPKRPLWEEISASMRRMGYNRSWKRCKEKWENINKYYKKVKEGSKKRPEDSKTCPYFHQLEAVYNEKNKNDIPTFNPCNPMVPMMVRPGQQWPLHQDSTMNDQAQDSGIDEDENDDEFDDEDEEETGGNEIATTTSKQVSVSLTINTEDHL